MTKSVAPPKIKDRNWAYHQYAIVGKRRGKTVWYCGGRVGQRPPLWSTGDGWAIVRGDRKAIGLALKNALANPNTKSVTNICIVKLTTKSIQTSILVERNLEKV